MGIVYQSENYMIKESNEFLFLFERDEERMWINIEMVPKSAEGIKRLREIALINETNRDENN